MPLLKMLDVYPTERRTSKNEMRGPVEVCDVWAPRKWVLRVHSHPFGYFLCIFQVNANKMVPFEPKYLKS